MTDRDHTPDLRRQKRLGFDEAVFCAHKRREQLLRIMDHAQDGQRSLLLTRLSPDQLAALPDSYRERIDYDSPSRTGIWGGYKMPTSAARIALVSAGTSDSAVAAEAVRTLRYYGETCHEIHDVGVAGIWRLLDRVEEIQPLPVVIAVAGMDAALPSVVAGLVPGIVIAVPVSTRRPAARAASGSAPVAEVRGSTFALTVRPAA